MLLRTYALIEHPAFIRFMSELEIGLREVEEPPAKHVKRSLPILLTAPSIADYLSISRTWVMWMIRKPDKHYRVFQITKRSGKKRTIHAPRTFLKLVQWWILDTILSHQVTHVNCFGFMRGRSYIDNAKQHIGANYVLNVDIENFFPSTSFALVKSVFSAMGYSPGVADGLAKLTTIDQCLPQGAPTSPMLTNIIFLPCDIELSALAESLGLRYTRYADDITFSSNERIPAEIVPMISACISALGYRLNESKTRFMGTNQRKDVTGIIIGQSDIGLDRNFLNACRGWFYNVANEPLLHAGLETKVRGTVELIRQVNGRGSKAILEIGERALLNIAQAQLASKKVD